MNGVVIAQLILTYGVPAAEQIWQMINKPAVTQVDWDNLKSLTSQTAKDRMKAQILAAGIAIDSPQAIALIALAS